MASVCIIRKEINGVSMTLDGVLLHNWLIMPDDIIQNVSENWIEIVVRSLATRLNMNKITTLTLNFGAGDVDYSPAVKTLTQTISDLRDKMFISNLISA